MVTDGMKSVFIFYGKAALNEESRKCIVLICLMPAVIRLNIVIQESLSSHSSGYCRIVLFNNFKC